MDLEEGCVREVSKESFVLDILVFQFRGIIKIRFDLNIVFDYFVFFFQEFYVYFFI